MTKWYSDYGRRMTDSERVKKYLDARPGLREANNAKRNFVVMAERQKESIKFDPRGYLLRTAKRRCKSNGREFTITKEDIINLTHCPYFPELELVVLSDTRAADNSMSLDRIDNTKGYIPENIEVISWKANRLKSSGTLEDFKAIVKRLEQLKGT